MSAVITSGKSMVHTPVEQAQKISTKLSPLKTAAEVSCPAGAESNSDETKESSQEEETKSVDGWAPLDDPPSSQTTITAVAPSASLSNDESSYTDTKLSESLLLKHQDPDGTQQEDNKLQRAAQQEKEVFLGRRCSSEAAQFSEALKGSSQDDAGSSVAENHCDMHRAEDSGESYSRDKPSGVTAQHQTAFKEYCQFLLGAPRGSELEDEKNIEDAWSIATKRKGVYNLMQVPTRLERLLLLGMIVCADEFLHLFTFLPLRCMFSLIAYPWTLLRKLLGHKRYIKRERDERKRQYGLVVTVVNFVQLSILIFASLVLNTFDISWIYHIIRGQSVIKIYVVFNVMEIFDRLCCSLGVDVLDSLGWTTTSAVRYWSRERVRERGQRNQNHSQKALRGFVLFTRVVLDYLFTLFYTSVHAVLLLTWVVALNVAINTQNNALITLLVSNNFIELKGSVFKNYKVQNLFQISCSDAVERFQYGVFLIVMFTYTAGDQRLFVVWGIMYICEILVDWIKHAFVTKFNRIHYKTYQQFSLVICNDIIQRRSDSVMRSIGGSAVSKRVGFISLPLGALVIRMVKGTLFRSSVYVSVLLFTTMCVLKVMLGIILIGHASRKLEEFRRNKSDFTVDQDDRGNENWYEILTKVGRYDHVSKY